jgi:hypothetical protein
VDTPKPYWDVAICRRYAAVAGIKIVPLRGSGKGSAQHEASSNHYSMIYHKSAILWFQTTDMLKGNGSNVARARRFVAEWGIPVD